MIHEIAVSGIPIVWAVALVGLSVELNTGRKTEYFSAGWGDRAGGPPAIACWFMGALVWPVVAAVLALYLIHRGIGVVVRRFTPPPELQEAQAEVDALLAHPEGEK